MYHILHITEFIHIGPLILPTFRSFGLQIPVHIYMCLYIYIYIYLKEPSGPFKTAKIPDTVLGCSGDLVSLLSTGLQGLLWLVMLAYRGYYLDLLSQLIIQVGMWSFGPPLPLQPRCSVAMSGALSSMSLRTVWITGSC